MVADWLARRRKAIAMSRRRPRLRWHGNQSILASPLAMSRRTSGGIRTRSSGLKVQIDSDEPITTVGDYDAWFWRCAT